MAKPDPSRREQEQFVLRVIKGWGKPWGPSFRELAYEAGTTLSVMYGICKRLRAEGEIEYEDGIARSLRLGTAWEEQ